MKKDSIDLSFRYEHENNCNFIVLEEEKNISEDYQIIMLGRNKIEHFLRFEIRIINGMSHIYYDISSKQQLTKLFEYGKLTMEDVKAVCRSLSEAVRQAHNYMLDIDRLVLSPEHMYADMSDRSIWFIYLPVETSKTFSEKLRKLFEYILEHFDHGCGKQEIVQLYELYQHILIGDYEPENLMLLFYQQEEGLLQGEDRPENFVQPHTPVEEELTIDDVPAEIVIDESEEEDKHALTVVRVLKAAMVLLMAYGIMSLLTPAYAFIKLTIVQAVILFLAAALAYCVLVRLGRRADVLRKIVRIPKEISYKIKASEMEKNTEENADDEVKPIEKPEMEVKEQDITDNEQQLNHTMLLSDYIKTDSEKDMLTLTHWPEGGEKEMQRVKIQPQNYPYIIGSMHKLSDYVIDKPFISKMHACIQKTDTSYYIEDLNSTNGTFLNDKRVIGRGEKPLESGDLLRLGMLSYKVEIT
ncbi:MAG: DUF6382 domain-containing protein [Eubacteriales bacterium]|nr:DUF6382 domain-containing protein [Eubacteriales bacterium]